LEKVFARRAKLQGGSARVDGEKRGENRNEDEHEHENEHDILGDGIPGEANLQAPVRAEPYPTGKISRM
jgi:hypothetical protein